MVFNNLALVCHAFGLVKTTRILFRKADIDCNSPYPEFCFNSVNNSPVPPGRKVLLDQRDRRVHKVLQDSRDLPVPPGHRVLQDQRDRRVHKVLQGSRVLPVPPGRKVLLLSLIHI